MHRILMAVPLVVFLGCVHATSPLRVEQRIAQPPQKGQVSFASRATEQIGEVRPVDTNVANGLPGRIRIEASQVFAINEKGERVAPIPTGEAIKLCGDATQLSSAMKSGLATALLGAALGGATGAAAGGLTASSIATGAAVGGAAGGAIGAGAGMEGGQHEASRQIAELALHDQYIEPGRSVNGYVFYPPGTYSAVEILVIDEEGEQSTLRSPLTESSEVGLQR